MDFNKIGWCHFTNGYWSGCTEVSPACDNCYARVIMQDRFKRVTWGAHQPRLPSLENARKRTRSIAAKAKKDGIRYRVFINSASDTFDAEVPDEWRHFLFEDIKNHPEIDFLLLTKRPGIASRYHDRFFRDGDESIWPRNAWLGVTVESPQYLWRLKQLPRTPAPCFASIEPMIEPFSVEDIRNLVFYANWVIVGGERSSNPRPIDLANAELIQDACRRGGVPFYFKQVSGRNPKDTDIPPHLQTRQFPKPR